MSSPVYRDGRQGVDVRVADLLGRMTVQQKVGQLRQILGFKCHQRLAGKAELNEAFRQAMAEGVGALYGLARADAFAGVTPQTALKPVEAAELANAAQRYAIEQTPLGIPLLLAEEAPHGVMALGTTLFPAPIGLASAFDPELAGDVAAAMAAELRAIGANVAYGPVLDLARDGRWSRWEETFGEDPYLASALGQAMVRALQESPDGPVAATLKHFAAYGETLGGHNGGTSSVGPRELHGVLHKPFRSAVVAGALSLMSSYNEIDGVPCTGSRELLTGTLRQEWGFAGFVVSDLYAIDGLRFQGVAADMAEAAAIALKAGVDLDLSGASYGPPLLEALQRGLVSAADIDLATARILRAKFTLGLFDRPYVEPQRAAEIVSSPAHRELSLRAARQSIVLLKNDGALPLAADAKSIAVIGPNADTPGNQLGDYTPFIDPLAVTTVRQGIERQVGAGVRVRYAKGCGVCDVSKAGFAEAVEAASQAELAVVVLGGSSNREPTTQFTDRGAADVSSSAMSDMDCGEGFDRCTLGLSGVQMELLEQLAATGKPLIVVLINGRPVELERILPLASAVMEAWYPGPTGGQAVAEVLFGQVNPSGKLPVSMPRTLGQSPVYYNHKLLARSKYVEMDVRPACCFGFGLSYTKFEYANLRVTPAKAKAGEPITVEVEVTNVGQVAGDEVVQLYVRDVVSSVMTPVKALKGFARVHLASLQRQTVRLVIDPSELTLLDQDLTRVVEPGTFEVMVGGNCEHTLTASFEIVV